MPRTRKYTPLERDSIESRILALLARRPFATADLAVRLGRTEREMGWFIGSLRKQRRVVPHVLRNKRQTWRLANTTTSYPPRVLKPLATKTEVGLTTEDEQWMTYWRQRNAAMTAVNQVVDALYRVFTATILFPDAKMEEHCHVLCRFGLAEQVAQGHALGYRITPRGYAEATARWGHEQR